MIDRGRGLPLARQATLLTLSRSSLYYEPRAVPATSEAGHLSLPNPSYSRHGRDSLADVA